MNHQEAKHPKSSSGFQGPQADSKISFVWNDDVPEKMTLQWTIQRFYP